MSTMQDAIKAQPASIMGGGALDGELDHAEHSMQHTTVTEGQQETSWARFMQVASLVFFAEWGDRSMLAAMALGASSSTQPIAIVVGAMAGHAVAAGIAVMCGVLAGKLINEQKANLISGLLFLLSAGATACSVL